MQQRMGSPLLLRPVATADGKAVAVLVRLRAPAVTSVELTGRPVTRPAVFGPAAIRRPNLATYPNSPLGPLHDAAGNPISTGSPAGSAVEAFLAFAAGGSNNFRRV